MSAMPPPPATPKRKQTAKDKLVGIVILLVLGAIVWTVCSLITTKHPSGPPGPGSVALSGTATEQALCAALDGPLRRLPALISAVQNDAESGLTLQLDGNLLELYLSETNNAEKVAGQIGKMHSDCARQAG